MSSHQIPANAPRTMGSAVAAAFLTASPSDEVRAKMSESYARIDAGQRAIVPLKRAAAEIGLHLERDGSGFVLYGKGNVEMFADLEAVAARLA